MYGREVRLLHLIFITSCVLTDLSQGNTLEWCVMCSGVSSGRGFGPSTSALMSGRPTELHADDQLMRRYRGVFSSRVLCSTITSACLQSEYFVHTARCKNSLFHFTDECRKRLGSVVSFFVVCLSDNVLASKWKCFEPVAECAQWHIMLQAVPFIRSMNSETTVTVTHPHVWSDKLASLGRSQVTAASMGWC